MRTMLILFVVCFLLLNSTSAFAQSEDPIYTAADIFLARPLGFVATVIGGGIFIVSLPFALPSGSVKHTADVLVGQPYRYTFKRPLGDFTTDVSYVPDARPEKKANE